MSPEVPFTMQATSSGAAQSPWLHQAANVWCVPFGHGQQTGVQSRGCVQLDPVAPSFQFMSPAIDAQVVSTFSEMLATESASVAVCGEPVHMAGDGRLLPLPLPHPTVRAAANERHNQGAKRRGICENATISSRARAELGGREQGASPIET